MAIDIGNTDTVCALIADPKKICTRWRNPTTKGVPKEALDAAQKAGAKVALSSVVPRATKDFLDAWGQKPLCVACAKTIPMPLCLKDPQSVGADRLLNAFAALKGGFPLPALIVDMGTATTIDLVDDLGRYRGGAILPGLYTAHKGLCAAVAAPLPDLILPPQESIGQSTASALACGAYWGHIGAIKGVIGTMTKELGVSKPYILATGGLSGIFAKDLAPDALIPDLTLMGLYYVAESIRAGS